MGNILDAIVNIDKSDKDFGKYSFVELKKNESILVAPNFAHGFYCYEDSKVLYLTDNNYSKENESGILWNSINFNWPVSNPILSLRDESFIKLSEV